MKYKTLNNVAHNIGHSFLSGLNYIASDNPYCEPVSVHVVQIAIDTNTAIFSLDLLSGECLPNQFKTPLIEASAKQYQNRFQDLLIKHGVSTQDVTSAQLKIHFYREKLLQYKDKADNWCLPVLCEVAIYDDRGVLHCGSVRETICTSKPPIDTGEESLADNAFQKVLRWIKEKLI